MTRTWTIGLLATGLLVAGATSAVAQTRPHVSGSESSRRTEATCTVNGEETACGGTHSSGPTPGFPSPIIVGISPVVIPIVMPGLGTGSGGHAGTDTDVDRSRHHGQEITR